MNKNKRREYLGCPIGRKTWYAISCTECIYSAKNEKGEHDHCMNYDEWLKEHESEETKMSDEELLEAIKRYCENDVAVVHAQWEIIKGAKNTIKCSNCGHIRELKHFGEIINRPKFCEMCGVKMYESND